MIKFNNFNIKIKQNINGSKVNKIQLHAQAMHSKFIQNKNYKFIFVYIMERRLYIDELLKRIEKKINYNLSMIDHLFKYFD